MFWVVVSRGKASKNDPAGLWYPEEVYMTRERARKKAQHIRSADSDLECRILQVAYPIN